MLEISDAFITGSTIVASVAAALSILTTGYLYGKTRRKKADRKLARQARVYKSKSGDWFFYDESGAHKYGPYISEAEALRKLKEYCEHLG